MVTQLGMSDLGYVALESDNNSDVFLGNDWGKRAEYSQEIAIKIDREVRDIVMHCYDKARQILRENRSLVDKLVEVLLEQETLEGDEFRQIVLDYGQTVDKKPVIPEPLSLTP